MRRFKKKYTKERSWDSVKIKNEKLICKKYGISNKKQLYILKTEVRRIKRALRNYGKDHPCSIKILERLKNLEVLEQKENYYFNVLNQFTVDHLLEKRLQTLMIKKGYKVNEARQKIVHGHVKIKLNGEIKTIRRPNFLVKKEFEIIV